MMILGYVCRRVEGTVLRTESVSYTHLDVYKRQITMIGKPNMIRKNK